MPTAELLEDLVGGFELIKMRAETTNKEAKDEEVYRLRAALTRTVEDCDYYIGLGNRVP
jgi:hypothetical protein